MNPDSSHMVGINHTCSSTNANARRMVELS